jgi:hypothetical protein
MLDIFVAESSAVLANCEAYTMATGLVICTRVFRVEGLDWITAFYTDWHGSWTGIAHWTSSLQSILDEAEGTFSVARAVRASSCSDQSYCVLKSLQAWQRRYYSQR